MRFSWQEKQKCRYCGEALDRIGSRSPHCGSLQQRNRPVAQRNKKVAIRENIEGDGFILIGDSSGIKENRKGKDSPIRNGKKVFLSIICAILPRVGQIAGIIAGLIFMYSVHDDSRSFGKALITASIVMFIISCMFIYYLVLELTTVPI